MTSVELQAQKRRARSFRRVVEAWAAGAAPWAFTDASSVAVREWARVFSVSGEAAADAAVAAMADRADPNRRFR